MTTPTARYDVLTWDPAAEMYTEQEGLECASLNISFSGLVSVANRVDEALERAKALGQPANATSPAQMDRYVLAVEVKRLREELAEHVENAFCQVASHGKNGWCCTDGLSTAVGLGDKLVALGLWEKKPGFSGRVQFYRPLETGQVGGEQ